MLLTRTNYPAIMLGSYRQTKWTIWFFVVFILLACFLILNLVTAVIYKEWLV